MHFLLGVNYLITKLTKLYVVVVIVNLDSSLRNRLNSCTQGIQGYL